MRILYAEWLKTKRTAIRLLAFCMPVVYAALIIGYFALRGIDKNTQTLVFQGFFEVWTVCYSIKHRNPVRLNSASRRTRWQF